MRRRDFIAILGSTAALPIVARAQVAARRPLVAILFPGSEESTRPNFNAFRDRLAELGFVEGRDVELAIRYADGGGPGVAMRLGAELLALSPAVIVVSADPMIGPVHKLTSSVPTVFVNLLTDPVAQGFAKSFPHPGGNMTGFMLTSTMDIVGKQLSLLKELAPTIARVDVLVGPVTAPFIPDTARRLNLAVRVFSIVRAEEVAPVIAAAAGSADALYVGTQPLLLAMHDEVVALVARTRLPALYAFREFVSAGGLMSYGANLRKNYAVSAEYVARILEGAKPSDLPIQQPNVYELVINAKTAKALALTIAPTLLAIADEVIE